jgi:hypothetical protein
MYTFASHNTEVTTAKSIRYKYMATALFLTAVGGLFSKKFFPEADGKITIGPIFGSEDGPSRGRYIL